MHHATQCLESKQTLIGDPSFPSKLGHYKSASMPKSWLPSVSVLVDDARSLIVCMWPTSWSPVPSEFPQHAGSEPEPLTHALEGKNELTVWLSGISTSLLCLSLLAR
mmetsp:Transcript_64233/g.127048  ORF Transcript_64233/g.127048 Transcript_64233/m.127048 type:complete len:107 (-) Transcript_64233:94-414(-)